MDTGIQKYLMADYGNAMSEAPPHIDSDECWCRPYWTKTDYGRFITHKTYECVINDALEKLRDLREVPPD